MKTRKKLVITNVAWKGLQSNRRKFLIKGMVYLIVSAISAFVARCMSDDHRLVVGWLMFFIAFIIFAVCAVHQFLCYMLLKAKPLLYKASFDKIAIGEIHQSLRSCGKVLNQQNGKTIVKTTLLDKKIVIGCFDITDDNVSLNFSDDILLVRKMEKQHRNVGYIIIYNIKCSTFDIRKFMKQQSLDNYALCDLRCFYFAEEGELITVYDKKANFCKQITEQLVKLLNSFETVGVISDEDNQR